MIDRRRLLPIAALILLLSACRDAKVTSYRVPKEIDQQMPAATATADAGAPAAAASAGAGMAATPVATASGAGLTWTAPTTWKAKPPSAMRKGSFTIPGEGGAEAELSITAFPGDVGGELANLNRWRGQISLPPVATSEAAAVTRLTQADLTLTIVDFGGTGARPQRIVGAMVPFGGATWFFKLMGPDAVVAQAKPAFLEFIKTVKAAPTAP